MQFDYSLFACALGLAFVLEGVGYFLFASKMPAMLRLLSERSVSELRIFGGIAIIVGLVLVYFARR